MRIGDDHVPSSFETASRKAVDEPRAVRRSTTSSTRTTPAEPTSRARTTIAHERRLEPRFSDPTAMALLPDDARERARRFLDGARPHGLRGRLERTYLGAQAKVMAARTVAIDDAIREAASPQLVILGAGLDGRAWRMGELRDTVVFEVDHPDSQRDKRERARTLTPCAREIRFVPVDFTRDDLDSALAAAGHDPTRPTTWVWEGVVMYLTLADIEATLERVARRSASGSRLIVLYHRPALLLRLVGLVVRRMGEPLRSAFTAPQIRALLLRYGFAPTRDEDVAAIGARLSPAVNEVSKSIHHLRIVTVDRP
jgi:methyltransferase (TIGR00027 family)